MLSEAQTQFYVAQLVLSLEYLHGVRILHRDVKPENVLMDSDGYVKLTDLGISAKMDADNTCRLMSGTPSYMAPEVFMSGHRHGIASDYFSLGVLMYEVLYGERPFRSKETKSGIDYDLVVPKQPEVSAHCVNFMTHILKFNPNERLGGGGQGGLELRAHPWLAPVDFQALTARTLKAPFVPDVTRANCDTGGNDLMDMMMPEERVPIPDSEQPKFSAYDFGTVLNAAAAAAPAAAPAAAAAAAAAGPAASAAAASKGAAKAGGEPRAAAPAAASPAAAAATPAAAAQPPSTAI